jgi:hypothetical protein
VTGERFRALALALEGAEERAHMGHPDFRVNGRIFASLTADERRAMVKVTPDEQAALLGQAPAVFVRRCLGAPGLHHDRPGRGRPGRRPRRAATGVGRRVGCPTRAATAARFCLLTS